RPVGSRHTSSRSVSRPIGRRVVVRRNCQSRDMGAPSSPAILRDRVEAMSPEPHDALMAKLLQAIEASLRATEASREAVQEILRRGAETGIFFAGARKPDGGGALPPSPQRPASLP